MILSFSYYPADLTLQLPVTHQGTVLDHYQLYSMHSSTVPSSVSLVDEDDNEKWR